MMDTKAKVSVYFMQGNQYFGQVFPKMWKSVESVKHMESQSQS